MNNSRGIKPLWLACLIIIINIACSVFTGSVRKPPSTLTSETREFTNPSLPINTPRLSESPLPDYPSHPTKVPASTETLSPSDTPEPSASPTSLPIGLNRTNPFPASEVASLTHWDVKVLEIKRGEDAWKDIQDANSFNEAAPAGMEYVLIKLRVKSKYTDSKEHSIGGCDFAVTGDRLKLYTCSMASLVEPEPQLDAKLYSGGETEGWVSFPVMVGESSLFLVFDEIFNLDDDIQYIALEEAAAISVSPQLTDISPNDLGKERNNPALRTEKVITEDWEILVTDVIRGEAAWREVVQANQFNDPPAADMEYVAVKVQVRYIGAKDKPENINSLFFKSTGSKNVLYDSPSVVDPEPALDIALYPGGEHEGWVTVQAAIGETELLLVFEPFFDFGGENQRFMELE